MAIEIRETIVTPDPTGDVVQLHISDVGVADEGGAFRLVLRTKLPPFQVAVLAQLQREAMKIAQDTFSELLQNMANEITNAGHNLNPRARR